MISDQIILSGKNQTTFWVVVSFVKNRLVDSGTIEWALKLNPSQHVERMAIIRVLNGIDGRKIAEPWRSAWRLIEESWSHEFIDGDASSMAIIKKQIESGDRSGVIISEIVNFVEPYLEVRPIGPSLYGDIKRPHRPRTFDHLLSAELTSNELSILNYLNLEDIKEVSFLIALADELDAAMNRGLNIARRIGWDGMKWSFRLGQLRWAGYGQQTHGFGEGIEPDIHSRGIAPVVKFLYAVVIRLAKLKNASARSLVRRWLFSNSPVHVRLWAATALDFSLVRSEEVEIFFSDLDINQFWDMRQFPEISALRARRFSALSHRGQKAIIARLRKGPPRRYWPKELGLERIENLRLRWILRELRRIELAGGRLPDRVQTWLKAEIKQFPDLSEMALVEDFPECPKVFKVIPHPDNQYDLLQGSQRLHALEKALESEQNSWDNDSASTANAWLQQPGKATLILEDLESIQDDENEFPHVWDGFGYQHRPRQSNKENILRSDPIIEVERVLILLKKLPKPTLSSAIGGISNWLDTWDQQVVKSTLGIPVWFRIWPIAVEATNAERKPADDIHLSVQVASEGDNQQVNDIDTLNTPSGRLIGVFLAACPPLKQSANPFAPRSALRQMRSRVIQAEGRSGLIARYRLIEHLPYFFDADRAWTKKYLISPLNKDGEESLVLWVSVAQQRQDAEVLKIIGSDMANKITDQRLGRDERESLVFSLVVDSLHALRKSIEPAVDNSRIQQMLRSSGSEIRVAAAGTIRRFIQDLSGERFEHGIVLSAEDLFHLSAKPFLQNVWPQERSLITPDISRALAVLPAASETAFAEAVDLIERFLVPFRCWSMIDYGLYGDEDGIKKLALIDNEPKARAFLRLLDSTIGTSEDDIIPDDLTDALDQILLVAPTLSNLPEFRRLSAAARC